MRLSQPVTQGGQTFLHRMRMFGQIVRLASFFATTTSMVVFLMSCYMRFSETQVKLYILAWRARLMYGLSGSHYILQRHRVSYWIATTEQFLKWVHQTLLIHLCLSFLVGMLMFTIMFLIWNRQGIQAHAKKTIAGSSLEPTSTVIAMIHKKNQASPLKLMDVPIIRGSETQHMLVTGTTGSGKTNACKHLLNQIRNQKAIIVDTTGEFVEHYFDPTRDIVMNPFDKRFPGWDLWSECQQIYHYDEIAESLIPQLGHDPFWAQSARTILTEILKVLASDHEKTIQKIVELSNMMSLADLHEKLIQTKAAALLDPQSEKTATSIRMNLASHIACLEHFQTFYHEPISIRNWVQSNKKGWLFLAMTPAQRATLRSVLSCWVSIAIKSLMECAPDHERRIWFIIDELPSLHKLTDLALCLSEGRKYGACMVLGIQNIPQLETIYGTQITKSLVDLCSTKLFFRCASFEMAQKLSFLIGMHERQEIQEGLSYGTNDMRDGVSLNLHTKEHPIIPPHELMNLPDLTSYLQLPHGSPITKITWRLD